METERMLGAVVAAGDVQYRVVQEEPVVHVAKAEVSRSPGQALREALPRVGGYLGDLQRHVDVSLSCYVAPVVMAAQHVRAA